MRYSGSGTIHTPPTTVVCILTQKNIDQTEIWKLKNPRQLEQPTQTRREKMWIEMVNISCFIDNKNRQVQMHKSS